MRLAGERNRATSKRHYNAKCRRLRIENANFSLVYLDDNAQLFLFYSLIFKFDI